MAISKILLISDVDDTLRVNKGPVHIKIKRGASKFRKNKGEFMLITGAPSSQIPLDLQADVYLAESGAIWKEKNSSTWTHLPNGKNALDKIKLDLGIKIVNGLQQIAEGTVIVEGIRYCSLTLLFGTPPHYPDFTATASQEEVLNKIISIVNSCKDQFPYIHIGHGTGTLSKNIKYIDISITTKAITVQRIVRENRWEKIYYMGDGRNDFEAMKVDGVIPVGFGNCVDEIKDLAKEKGIYIPISAPPDGVAAFFEILQEREPILSSKATCCLRSK